MTLKKRKILLCTLPLAICLVVAFVFLFGRHIFGESPGQGPDSGTRYVTIGGIKCIPKQNIRTYLFMGIDNTEEHTEDNNIGGQADVLRLLVVDRTAGTYTQLPINRNTIMNVGNYTAEGEYIGDSQIQVSFAHMGGDGGGELSCQNTVNAVSDFLYGQKIDGYISLGMDDIGLINDIAGGVTVTIEDDFSNSDPTLKIGDTVTLTNEQAYHFVHDRKNVGDGSNECRMRRQNAYLEGLKENMFAKIRADEKYIYGVYKQLGSAMDTNMTEEEFGKLGNALSKYQSAGVLEIDGTIGMDDFEFATFVADEQSKAETVVKLFYTAEE